MPAGTLPPVQKAVFTLLPNLAPADMPELWPDLIDLLLHLLKPHLVEAAGSVEARAAEASPSGGATHVNKHAITSLSMEKAVEILAHLYRYLCRLLLVFLSFSRCASNQATFLSC
jgi:hypothetical protein